MSCKCFFIPKTIEDSVYLNLIVKNKILERKIPLISDDLRMLRQKQVPDLYERVPAIEIAGNNVFSAQNRRRQPGILIAHSFNEATLSKDAPSPNFCTTILVVMLEHNRRSFGVSSSSARMEVIF